MATLEEIIAAQQAAQAMAAQSAEAARLAEAQATQPVNQGVTPALPAEGLPAMGGAGKGQLTTVKPATSENVKTWTPPKSFTQATGTPKTAVVTSVGYEPTGSREASAPGPPAAVDVNPLAQETRTIPTRYGDITTTAPAQPAAQNPIAQEGPLTEVQARAQAYRDATTPEARAAAKAQYAGALNASAKTGTPRTMAEAFGEPQRPAEDPAKIAKYNANLERLGINPHEIGTAQMNAQGGLDVMSIPEEREAKHAANRAAEEMQVYINNERQARLKARYLKGADKEAAEQSVLEAKREKNKFGIQSGLINPKNPKAGMDMDNAERQARADLRLARDPSSLVGLSQQRIQKPTSEATAKKTEETKAQPEGEKPKSQAERQALEMAEMTAYQQAEAARWYEEQRRKQQEMFGGFSPYAYQGS